MENLKRKISENINNKGKIYLIIALLILLIGLFRMIHYGSIFVSNKVSISKQLRQHTGVHIWMDTDSGDGKGKDAVIDDIYVIKHGKLIQYQIFDDDFTLGKASKMNNRQLIDYGKKQDRKYFSKSIDEVRAFRDDKKQIGLQNDLFGYKELKDSLDVGATFDMEASDEGYSKKIVPSNNGDNENVFHQTENDLIDKAHDCEGADPDSFIPFRKQRLNALIDNMRSVKYLSPKWQKVSIKYKTDETGNNVIEEKLKYNSIDEFSDADKLDENVMTKLSNVQRQRIINLYNKCKDANDMDDRSSFANKGHDVFDSEYYHNITKGIFKPNTFKDEMVLHGTTSQRIYNSRFIGYSLGNDAYLLTKAQSNTQRCVLQK